MKELTELKCPNCGAPINRATMRCEYCGAIFKDDFNQIICLEHSTAVPLKTVMRIDKEFATLPRYEEYVVDSVARSLADKVSEYMEMEFQDDLTNNQVVVQGRVRIIPPGVRFL